MFKEYVIKILAAEYEDKILIFDFDGIESRYSYSSILSELGFQIISYNDALEFRYTYEREIKKSGQKYAIIVEYKQYIPYDILFPVELDKPFDLSREEKEFIQNAESLGYLDKQICYTRGYDLAIGPGVKCLSIILNDIDDLVHGQMQGRTGMFNDIHLLARSGKIQKLVNKLYKMGFNIYLTSDHGNTLQFSQ